MSSESMSFISTPSSDSDLSASSQPSLILGPDAGDEIDSLPDSEADSDDLTVSESEEDYEESDADKEWKESLQQLEMLLSMVIVPYLGKYFGRKFAYYGWKQFMEWKYPVQIEMTNKAAFKATGVVSAAATL